MNLVKFINNVAKILSVNTSENSTDMKISIPKGIGKYTLEKGYIGINGCSLTVGKVSKSNFNIHLIPETLSVTNLDSLIEGSAINVEIDQNTISIVETVKRTLAAQKSR